jgi:hypothetical protein
MAAPTPEGLAPNTIENSDIESRLAAFMDQNPDSELEDPSNEEPAEEEPEPVAAASEESDEAPAEEAEEGEEQLSVEGETEEPEVSEEDAERGINTLADLAKEFDMPESDFLNHLEVDGPDGTVTLANALETFRNAPASAHRWAEIGQAEQRLVAVDQEMQASHAETARNLAAHLQVAIDMTQAQFKDINWTELENVDPTQYMFLRQKQREVNEQIGGAIDTLKGMETQRDASIANQAQHNSEREVAELTRKLPDLRDPQVATQMYSEVSNFLGECGFSAAEIAQMADHRYLLVAIMAKEHHKLQKGAPKKIKQLERLPSVRKGALKSGRSRTDERTAAQKRHQRHVKSLKETGSTEAAGSLIEDFL